MDNRRVLPAHNTIDEQPLRSTAFGPVTYVQPAPSTAVIINQPSTITNTMSVPMAGEGRNWNHGILDCCDDCGACALGFFCPVCMMCCILNSIGELTCCVYASGVGGSALMSRIKIRTALGIRGSFCGDVCCTTCCLPCASCQMYKELKDIGQLNNNCCNCSCDCSKQCLCN